MTGNKIIADDLETIYNSNIDWSYFAGKTILISGANGFLPAYMVESLLYAKYKSDIQIKVIALVRNIQKAKKRFEYYRNNGSLIFIEQDVCEKIIFEEEINYVIHAASQASPKYYGADPVGTLKANVLGTINMLELSKRNNVDSFLYFSSAEVYGQIPNSKKSVNENDYGFIDPTEVRSCYAESKKMGENICISYAHQYGVKVKIVRPFHTYGPGMDLNDGRVFVDFVANIVYGTDIIMKSDGSAKRAYCYISDAVTGYFKILTEGCNGESYNVGNPKNEYSVIELANLLISLFENKKLQVINGNHSNQGYLISSVNRIVPDIKKLNKLGWVPKISVEDGFRRTISSYDI